MTILEKEDARCSTEMNQQHHFNGGRMRKCFQDCILMFKNWVSSTSLIFMITILVLAMLCCVVASEPEDHRQEQQRGHDQIRYKNGMMIIIITKMITLAVLSWFTIYYQPLLLDEAPEEERGQEAEQEEAHEDNGGGRMRMRWFQYRIWVFKNWVSPTRLIIIIIITVLVLVVPRCVLASEPEDRPEQQRGHDHILYKNGMMIIITEMILLAVAAWFAIYYQSLLLGQAPQEETEQEPEQEEAHNDNGGGRMRMQWFQYCIWVVKNWVSPNSLIIIFTVLVPRCVLASEPEDRREQQRGHDHVLYKNGMMIMALVAVFALYYQIQLDRVQRGRADDIHGGINNGAEDLHGAIDNNHPDEGNNAGNFAARIAAQNDQEKSDRGY